MNILNDETRPEVISVKDVIRWTGDQDMPMWVALGKLVFSPTVMVCPESYNSDPEFVISDNRLAQFGHYINAYFVSETEKVTEGDFYYDILTKKVQKATGFFLDDEKRKRYLKILVFDEELSMKQLSAIKYGNIKEEQKAFVMCKRIYNSDDFMVKRPNVTIVSADQYLLDQKKEVATSKSLVEHPPKVNGHVKPTFPQKVPVNKIRLATNITIPKEDLFHIIRKRDEYLSKSLRGENDGSGIRNVEGWFEDVIKTSTIS